MSRIRTGVAATLVLIGGVATAKLSQWPYRVPASAGAVVRLAWSGRPERIEHCRRLTDQELEAVPAHMRQRVHCEGRASRYRLEVKVDGQSAAADILEGGGARSDRPIHLLLDVPVGPGGHLIELAVDRIDSIPPPADSGRSGLADAGGTPAGGAREQREAAERDRARREAMPPRLRFEQTIDLAAGEVVVITYNRDQKRLILLRRIGS